MHLLDDLVVNCHVSGGDLAGPELDFAVRGVPEVYPELCPEELEVQGDVLVVGPRATDCQLRASLGQCFLQL